MVNGSWQKEYFYVNGQLLASHDKGPAWVRYYFRDHLGSTRIITRPDGGKYYDADYYPFGGERVYLNACPDNYKFTGKERDPESALDYFGARYYSNPIGRFLSCDPSRAGVRSPDPQTWNQYSYALNNPLRYIDPDGEAPTDLIEAAVLLSVHLHQTVAIRQALLFMGAAGFGMGAVSLYGGLRAAGIGFKFAAFEVGEIAGRLGVVGAISGGSGVIFGGEEFALSGELFQQAWSLREQARSLAKVVLLRIEQLLQPKELGKLPTVEIGFTVSELRNLLASPAARLLAPEQRAKVTAIITFLEAEKRDGKTKRSGRKKRRRNRKKC